MKKLISMLFLALPSMVGAHAVIQQTDAESGSYYKGVIGLSHGCEGSVTTKVTITIPNGFRGAKPMPKPGWKLDVVKSVLERSYQSHGKTITEDVTQITWYGGVLEHAHYDEFVFRGQIGVGTGTRLYFPVRQECVVGELNWDQKPGDKPKAHDHHGTEETQTGHSARLEYPAPVVRVVDGTSMHHH